MKSLIDAAFCPLMPFLLPWQPLILPAGSLLRVSRSRSKTGPVPPLFDLSPGSIFRWYQRSLMHRGRSL